MRVAIAEDDPVYRAGLVNFVRIAGVEVSHEAASSDELLVYLRRGELPDVAIMDIRMAGQADDGLIAAEYVVQHYPQIGILLLSSYHEVAHAERLFATGSAGKGYMLKETLNAVPRLKEALERIEAGLTYCDPKIVDELIAQKRTNRIQDLLSAREMRILSLLASGASNDAIVTSIQSSPGAVESAIGRIYAKLAIPRGSDYTPRVLAVLRWLSDTA